MLLEAMIGTLQDSADLTLNQNIKIDEIDEELFQMQFFEVRNC